ncbi:efflux RND transporter permease subunit [Desulfoluna butyratoxydans]|uniref:Membrane transport protein mmpl domain n=1 Tax=Desulfoluna butyratoxydans TaxID=231438 RepID=A0A4U8YPJ2_9BACT|nr:MMPL family transporter [Desulfoluna butyratoxydans]VFQ45690.1 membrane transport protein mmpl domain [Desulfoluna butyratoxydans]
MERFNHLIERTYRNTILKYPILTLVLLAALTLFFAYEMKDFRLDASAETLVLDNDEDLNYFRQISERFGQQDYLIIAYKPKGDLFSEEVYEDLNTLKAELAEVSLVESVLTLLDVPLLESPPLPVKELAANIRTLTSPETDQAMARDEILQSPVYRDLLVSPDGTITSVIINLKYDHTYMELLGKRDALKNIARERALTREEKSALKQAETTFWQYREEARSLRHDDIAAIRAIMDTHRDKADLFLGGVSMIADDLITFIKNDIRLFGGGMALFLVVTLGLIFGQVRWVILPMLCCFVSVIHMSGILGFMGWEVTVISSNFISLQLIITMAIAIHLIVRHRELHKANPQWSQMDLTARAAALMATPCLFATLTTIAGFGSLISSDILPVITFGWMMSAGILVSLCVTFILLPALLVLIPKGRPPKRLTLRFPLPEILGGFTERHGRGILTASVLALLFCLTGMMRLEVENSFIDYFKKSTEIYQGMKLIDDHLGGTTPLDVVITFDEAEQAPEEASEAVEDEEANGDFADFEEFEEIETGDKYWFTQDKVALVDKVHTYLDALPETGKILSLASLTRIAEKLNDGKPLDNFALALLYSEIPEQYRELLLKPYVSVEHNEAHLSIRIKDSAPELRRDEFLKQVNAGLIHEVGLAPDKVKLNGMLVLYNNMLQSLFSSQILTLGIVLAALAGMFLLLFRSPVIALIALLPNILSIGVVLGLMGWLGIPLDMMTITIAAISVGIAVDDTIHYIHRFKSELEKDGDYMATMHRCHGSIGHAMYFTSITIISGFSILVLSNFIPSILFGLLTGLAMAIALISALTLLPRLILILQPFGKEASAS